MRELEIKLLWGARAKQTINGKVRTWSGGVKTLCGLNGSHSLFRDFNGQMLTKGSFDAFLQRYFAQSAPGRSKIMLSGYNFITIMNNWAYAKLRINDQATEKFGLSIYKYQSPYGDLSIMPHKLWGLDPDSGRGLGLQDEAWILDLDSMKLCGLPGRADLTMTTTQEGSTELQEHGEDAVHKEINVEEGLKLKGTENFGFISGIAA